MDLFENFIFKNNDKVSNILLGHDIVNNCSREKLKSLFLRSEVVEELLENCESLVDSNCHFIDMGQVHERDQISMKIILGYFDSTFFLIDYNTSEDEPLKVEVFDKIPVNHCYKSCKERFELIETLLDGYEEHKDDVEFTENFSLEVNWGFDFLQYLSNKGFDTSLFLRIQNRLNDINNCNTEN